jgi:hypothetical protein
MKVAEKDKQLAQERAEQAKQRLRNHCLIPANDHCREDTVMQEGAGHQGKDKGAAAPQESDDEDAEVRLR